MSDLGTLLRLTRDEIQAGTEAAAATGVILTPGVSDGQLLTLINTSGANSITFAASGTSNVALGTGASIAALSKLILQWSATQSLWY